MLLTRSPLLIALLCALSTGLLAALLGTLVFSLFHRRNVAGAFLLSQMARGLVLFASVLGFVIFAKGLSPLWLALALSVSFLMALTLDVVNAISLTRAIPNHPSARAS
jgi:hypothetical protein